MSTLAQHAANILNSRLSTGPKSAQGRAISSRNSQKHGLTAKQVVIQGENIEEFEDLKRSLYEDHKPANTMEQLLVNEIAENYWRLMRARRLETELLDRDLEAALSDDNKQLDKIRRYMTSIERAWHKAITQLQKTQAIRRDEEEAARNEAERERAAEIERHDQELHDYLMAPMPSASPIGFVSQNAKSPTPSPQAPTQIADG